MGLTYIHYITRITHGTSYPTPVVPIRPKRVRIQILIITIIVLTLPRPLQRQLKTIAEVRLRVVFRPRHVLRFLVAALVQLFDLALGPALPRFCGWGDGCGVVGDVGGFGAAVEFVGWGEGVEDSCVPGGWGGGLVPLEAGGGGGVCAGEVGVVVGEAGEEVQVEGAEDGGAGADYAEVYFEAWGGC